MPQTKTRKKSNLQRAWQEWLSEITEADGSVLKQHLGSSFLDAKPAAIPYQKYDNLLILPAKSLEALPICPILDIAELQHLISRFWAHLAKTFKVTHIGSTRPIPLDLETEADTDPSTSLSPNNPGHNGTNVLRSPTSFQPLHGSFGDTSRPPFSFSAADSAFWATATQYGVTQSWSPLYTMFSNGNVSEKGRITQFEPEPYGITIDLYAGIGYFALFYRRYVTDIVLCWEINPWSVEGFRRGAAANGWARETSIICEDEEIGELNLPPTLSTLSDEELAFGIVVFQESNERAVERMKVLRHLPPVKHVNCGYLPSSKPSWKTAVELLIPDTTKDTDAEQLPSGWVHAHINLATKEIPQKSAEILNEFRDYTTQRIEELGFGPSIQADVTCDHKARVKTYAPGVMHCVLDIRIKCKPHMPR